MGSVMDKELEIRAAPAQITEAWVEALEELEK